MGSNWVVDPGYGCHYFVFDPEAGCFYVIDKQAEDSNDEADSDDEVESVIEKFIGSLDSVESDVQVEVEPKRHWWDGWEKEETLSEEEDGLLYSLFEEEETSLFAFQDEEDASGGEEEEDAVSELANEDDPEEGEAYSSKDCLYERIEKLREENFILTEQICCMEDEMAELKEKFTKEWEFSVEKRNEELKNELAALNTIFTTLDKGPMDVPVEMNPPWTGLSFDEAAMSDASVDERGVFFEPDGLTSKFVPEFVVGEDVFESSLN